MTATETLEKIIQLTTANLELLSMINESFYTKKEYLTTMIDDTRYTIPSFISLENKVNHLQAAFNNLVHAPMTGEAYMNFDGNSRVIQMRGFQQAPVKVDLSNQDANELKYFYTEESDLFKDMLSPKPYIKLDLSEIEDDITQVVVKKIIIYNQSIIAAMDPTKSITVSSLDYPSMNAILTSGNQYLKGQDYAEYDTVYTLPIRKLTCSGDYIVSAIISDEIDDALNNIITLQLDESTPAECQLFDGVTTRALEEGDILTNFDGSSKLQIIEVQQSPRILTVRVLSGEYVNIIPNVGSSVDDDKISDYSRLRFFQPVNFDSDKYLKVPLEEDQYIFIAVAPLNSRMNVQAPWGEGLVINTDSLTLRDVKDAQGNSIPFRSYYQSNVKNIGDTVNELAAILPAPLTNLSPIEFATILNSKPYMTADDDTIDTLKVVQINKHLNEAENIKTIRNLYSQKQQYKIDLEECQNKIASLNAELAEISFDDMTGSRTMISAQIDDLKTRQNELIKSINTAIDAISLAANDTEVPIEDSKFRIRGYVNIDRFLNKNLLSGYGNYIRAIRARYRYKNPGIAELANVTTFGGGESPDYLFTEWCDYRPSPRHKTAAYSSGSYIVGFDDPKQTENDVKFNQIDIPITQGEQVDLQVKIIWDFGYPFINIESDWSDVVTIKFPQELVTDVEVTTIIKENNSDIETYRFENILDNHGITQHSNDYIDDQNIRYFHKPESISSGFYTDERRVIPLADKLKELNNKITSLQDAMEGTYASNLKVALVINNTEYELSPDIQNNVSLPAYNSVDISTDIKNAGTSIIKANDGAPATAFGSLNIKNVSNNTVRLYAMVPGARDIGITKSRKFHRILNTYWDYAEPLIENNIEAAAADATGTTQMIYQAASHYLGSGSNNNVSVTFGPGGPTTAEVTTALDVQSMSYEAGNHSGYTIVPGGSTGTGGGTSTGGGGGGTGTPTVTQTSYEYECDLAALPDNEDGITAGTAHDYGDCLSVTFEGNQARTAHIQIYPIITENSGSAIIGNIKRIYFTNRDWENTQGLGNDSNALYSVEIHRNMPNGSVISRSFVIDDSGRYGALSGGSGFEMTKSSSLYVNVSPINGTNTTKWKPLIIEFDTGGGHDSYGNDIVLHKSIMVVFQTDIENLQNEQDPQYSQLELSANPSSLALNNTSQPDKDVTIKLSNIDNCIDWENLKNKLINYTSDEYPIAKINATATNGITVTFPKGRYFNVSSAYADESWTGGGPTNINLKVNIKYDTSITTAGTGSVTFGVVPVNIVGENVQDNTPADYYNSYGTSNTLEEFKGVSRTVPVSYAVGENGSNSGYTGNGWISSSTVYDYTDAPMVYILNPLLLTESATQNNLYSYVNVDKTLKNTLNEQLCNQFITFRIKDPFTGDYLGDPTESTGDNPYHIGKEKGIESLPDQETRVNYIASGDHVFSDSFVYATPATTSVGDICIESDSTHAVMELGPGESVSVPIFVGYVINENQPLKSYSIGFDIRNSLYNDPLFYQINLQARYNQSFADMLQSQRASIRTATNYNPVVRS